MRRTVIAVCAGLWLSAATAQTCPADPTIIYNDREALALRLFAIRPMLFDLTILNQLPQTLIMSERSNQVTGSS